VLTKDKAKLQIAIIEVLNDCYLISGAMDKEQLSLFMASAAEQVFDTANQQALYSSSTFTFVPAPKSSYTAGSEGYPT
jgi:hypothetical protein